jgi:tungstate transport system ATP-binding protein
MTSLIELEKLTYKIGKKSILTIPYFGIQPGEFLGIMGPNGAGKSTFLKVVAFLESQSSGNIFYQGEEIPPGSKAPLELRRKFSIALQQSLLLDTTVFQNIALGLKIRKVPKSIIKERVNLWMDQFQISHLAKKNSHHLSGGEAQRVNLARAMIIEPEILFLDEPFAALDFPTKIKLMEDFKQIMKQAQITTVFVSHDLMEIDYLTNKLAIMVDGEIKQYGCTEDVLRHPNASSSPFLNEWKKFYPLTVI